LRTKRDSSRPFSSLCRPMALLVQPSVHLYKCSCSTFPLILLFPLCLRQCQLVWENCPIDFILLTPFKIVTHSKELIAMCIMWVCLLIEVNVNLCSQVYTLYYYFYKNVHLYLLEGGSLGWNYKKWLGTISNHLQLLYRYVSSM
jgi:hypothetical protein